LNNNAIDMNEYILFTQKELKKIKKRKNLI